MPEQSSLKPRRNARASKVLVTKADGTQEVQNAYNRVQLRAVDVGKNPLKKQQRKRRKQNKRLFITKTRYGELVACGSVDAMKPGLRVSVFDEHTKQREERTVIELGEPFERKHRMMVYGYFRAFSNRTNDH